MKFASFGEAVEKTAEHLSKPRYLTDGTRYGLNYDDVVEWGIDEFFMPQSDVSKVIAFAYATEPLPLQIDRQIDGSKLLRFGGDFRPMLHCYYGEVKVLEHLDHTEKADRKEAVEVFRFEVIDAVRRYHGLEPMTEQNREDFLTILKSRKGKMLRSSLDLSSMRQEVGLNLVYNTLNRVTLGHIFG